ncbi:pectinesterase family protein [Spirochaeta cellobiosiphila]|uniref:pectinesterase family protein n=1 Tax=Spirochaeta cellobiosiphila TaxID=504483 RepID=UPI00069EADED|nr:pectinesterase family protein [Spirochaeta cellobiosiphila]
MRIKVGPFEKYTRINDVLKDYSSSDETLIIELSEGIYEEKISVLRPHVQFIGSGRDKTKLLWSDGAIHKLPNGNEMGTFNSFTLYIGAEDFYAAHLTVENGAGEGHKVGQAVAVYADSDKVFFRDCSLLGHQDTLCTGPLPADPFPKSPEFILPFHSLREGKLVYRQYYEDCFIEGDVDFIFGSARVVFHHCEISSARRSNALESYVTAGSHPEWEPYGYQFWDCRLTGSAHEQSVYLGRPWRPYAKTEFWNCYLGEHIKGAGWDHWRSEEKKTTSRYREVNSHGPGFNSSERVSWALIVDDPQLAPPSLEDIFESDKDWILDKTLSN